MKTTLMPTFKKSEQEIEAAARNFIAQNYNGEYVSHVFFGDGVIKDSQGNLLIDLATCDWKMLKVTYKEKHVD